MFTPPYILLLIRTFLTLEGIASRVDPDFNIYEMAMPWAMRRSLSPESTEGVAALRSILLTGQPCPITAHHANRNAPVLPVTPIAMLPHYPSLPVIAMPLYYPSNATRHAPDLLAIWPRHYVRRAPWCRLCWCRLRPAP